MNGQKRTEINLLTLMPPPTRSDSDATTNMVVFPVSACFTKRKFSPCSLASTSLFETNVVCDAFSLRKVSYQQILTRFIWTNDNTNFSINAIKSRNFVEPFYTLTKYDHYSECLFRLVEESVGRARGETLSNIIRK